MNIQDKLNALIKKYTNKATNIDYSGGNSSKERRFISELKSLLENDCKHVNKELTKSLKRGGCTEINNEYYCFDCGKRVTGVLR